MYREFYSLKEIPFRKTPDPAFLFMSRAHEEALARLQYAVEERELMLLTGEIGSGKTTLTRALINELDDSYVVILLLNPRLTATQFLRTIAKRLGLDGDLRYKDLLIEALYQRVYELYEEGKTPVIIIDEAQLIPRRETFEEIRLLTNFQLDNANLLSLILVAQPDIRRRLKHRVYAPLRQRIGLYYHIGPLDLEEVGMYIRHRLEVSGRDEPLFTPEAVELIHRYSGGIPRMINSIATTALLEAFGREDEMVDSEHILDAVKEIGLDGPGKDS